MLVSSRSEIERVCAQFPLHGTLVNAAPYGSGHINDTYAVTYDQAGTTVRYIFQRVNRRVFKHVPELMDNISRVLHHVSQRLSGKPDASRRALTILEARDGRPFACDAGGDYWRVYLFIEHAKTFDLVTSPEQAYAAGYAFGAFQHLVAGLPGPRLHETIPDFHNTPKRFEALEAAIAADPANRVKDVAAEIAFARERRELVGALLDLHQRGIIPERITHNDTKLNNVMLDDASGEGICVIDLDTVMPGLAPYDFGDLIRSGANSSAEDTTDPESVHLVLPIYEAALRGFLSTAGDVLTEAEIAALPLGAKLMTFEVGIRFLTDFLEGDVYFKTRRPQHNLDRCRCQFALLRSMELQSAEMNALTGTPAD